MKLHATIPTKQIRGAFSLLELLTVMSIMAIFLALSGPVFQNIATGSGVKGAVSIGSATVNLARNSAVLTKEGSRILIDADPTSEHYLRRMAVVQGKRQANGTIEWQLDSKAILLPESAYFSQNRSSGYGSMKFDFSNGGVQNGTGGSDCFFFEYDASGRLVPPASGLASLVFTPGNMMQDAGNRSLVVPPSKEAMLSGFILRPAGNVTYYADAGQIPPAL